MYRLLILTITYLLVPVCLAQAQEDIVMKIGDHPVYKNEFVDEYRKSQSTSVKEFIPLFVARKMRILDLQDRGIDTLTSFKILLANYQGEKLKAQYLENYKKLQNASDVDSRFSDNRWVKYQLIEKYIPQNSPKYLIDKIHRSSDSIYNALKSGADFNALSIKCSDKKDDIIPHWSRVSLLPSEVIPLFGHVKAGDILTPVLTASGYSILKIDEFSESTPDEIIDKEADKYIKKLKSLQNVPQDKDIVSELLYKLSIANDTTSNDLSEDAIRKYYNKNTSKYYYDEPRFKGAVLHCSSKKMAKVIKKYLKRYEFNKWQEAINELTKDEVSPKVKIETGIFKKGDNKFVDELIFKVGNGDIYSSTLPYSFTIGKKLKRKPDSLDDVRENVRADIINNMEISQKHNLVEKYRVEIDYNVLKTVNNSGSN